MLKKQFSKQKLEDSWSHIYLSKTRKKRRTSRGIDGISIEDFENNKDHNLNEIHRHLQGDFFEFDELLLFKKYKKGKSKPRIIQSPTIKDRIVQHVINEYLVSKYFKKDFNKVSIVGSVKGTTLKDAIKRVASYYKEGYYYVLKTDIADYFPSIDVDTLKKIVGQKIKGKDAKKYVYKYLSMSKEKGIPQGPALSPLMANLYLFSFDKYLSSRKKIKHIRYVDDILIFCKNRKTAIKSYKYIRKQLKKKGLTVHRLNSDKTQMGILTNGNIHVLGVLFKKDKIVIKDKKISDLKREKIQPISSIKNLLSNKKESVNCCVDSLIEQTNYQIQGWGNAYKFCDVKDLYEDLDIEIEKQFLKLFEKLNKQGLKSYTKNKVRSKLKEVKKLKSIKLKPMSV